MPVPVEFLAQDWQPLPEATLNPPIAPLSLREIEIILDKGLSNMQGTRLRGIQALFLTKINTQGAGRHRMRPLEDHLRELTDFVQSVERV